MPVRPSPSRCEFIPFAAPPPADPPETARDVLRLPSFRALCQRQGVEPTLRQARKYRARRGRRADAANRQPK